MSEATVLDHESMPVEIEVIRDAKKITYHRDLKRIDKKVFPNGFFDEEEIKESLIDPRSALVLLRKDSGEVIGYGLAGPTNKPQVAHNTANAILPEFQGKGHIEKISKALEAELTHLGYVFVTRETKEAEEYAEKVRKAYSDRIVKEEKTKNKMGKAITFTVRL